MFEGVLTSFGVKIKRGNTYFGNFFKINLCSVIHVYFKSFRRDLSIDLTEHKSIVRHKLRTTPFYFHKTGENSQKRYFVLTM